MPHEHPATTSTLLAARAQPDRRAARLWARSGPDGAQGHDGLADRRVSRPGRRHAGRRGPRRHGRAGLVRHGPAPHGAGPRLSRCTGRGWPICLSRPVSSCSGRCSASTRPSGSSACFHPVACLVLFLTAMARLGGRLLGRWGVLAVSLLSACCLETVGVFIPGHIHHHALQVMLLMVLAAVVAGGVSHPDGRASRAAWAGGLSALTLAINLQNLPFVLVTVAAFGSGWLIRGAAFDRALRNFALASMVGTGLLFLLQVPPDRYLAPTYDAFGAPHVLAFWIVGAGLLVLGSSSRLLPTPIGRAAAAALLGASSCSHCIAPIRAASATLTPMSIRCSEPVGSTRSARRCRLAIC